MRKIFPGLVCALVAASAGAACAQEITVIRTPASAPALGTIIRGSTATTYSISTSGVVTRAAGNAIRLSNASVTTPTIVLTCGWTSECRNRKVRVTIAPSGNSGNATIVKLRRGSVSGYSTTIPSVSEGATLTFDLPAMEPTRLVSFPIGMDVQLAAGATARIHTFSYTVTAEYR